MWNTQHLHYDHGRHHFSLGAVGVLPILVSKVVLPANQQLATATIEDAAAIRIINYTVKWIKGRG